MHIENTPQTEQTCKQGYVVISAMENASLHHVQHRTLQIQPRCCSRKYKVIRRRRPRQSFLEYPIRLIHGPTRFRSCTSLLSCSRAWSSQRLLLPNLSLVLHAFAARRPPGHLLHLASKPAWSWLALSLLAGGL